MAKRKKYFKTRKEAQRYLAKTYKRTTVFDPAPADMKVYPLGARFFLGTGVEFDFARFS